MRSSRQAFIALAFCTALAEGALAAEIVDTPRMGLVGPHSFKAIPATPGDTITWTVDRVTRSESNGGSESIRRNHYKATGLNATFDLKKVSGKQTIWRVRATDSAGSDVQEVQVFPPNKLSSFTFASTGNPIVRTYVVVPSSLREESKLLFVLHGASRNANDYCNYWRNWTADHGIVLLCPRFEESKWPGGRGYNRGNVFADDKDTKLNPENKWAYTVLEKIHGYARSGFGLDDERFDIWGHSAGGQFIERFLFFKPDAKLRLAMIANPGWYMLPSLTIAYPCGAKHAQLNFTQADLLEFSEREAVLFQGTADTDPNDPETGGCMDAQGKGRYARAGYFYSALKTFNPQTTWELVYIPNVDHDGERMAKEAQAWLDSR